MLSLQKRKSSSEYYPRLCGIYHQIHLLRHQRSYPASSHDILCIREDEFLFLFIKGINFTLVNEYVKKLYIKIVLYTCCELPQLSLYKVSHRLESQLIRISTKISNNLKIEILILIQET